MNKLPIQKRVQIITLLVAGNSLRYCSRIADVSINTVTKLLVDVGKACAIFHNETVKGIDSQRVQCDEIWSFVYAKEKNKPENMQDVGDVWTWTAIDSDPKLIISWLVRRRDADCANDFMQDVANRIKRRVQITTDGLNNYLEAVTEAFGSQIDFAQLVKLYGDSEGGNSTERKYKPSGMHRS